jgi:hypothetical protein
MNVVTKTYDNNENRKELFLCNNFHFIKYMRYCSKVMENIVAGNNANNKQVCCINFLINDIAKSSLHQALTIEKAYDESKIPGLMYCIYKTETLLSAEIKDLVELFEGHDQVFILKQDDVYKLHITKENIHKLFLN